jgi:hypothetical protein
MRKYKLSLLVLILVSVYALYMALFFAWLTATPLSASDLVRAQHHCYFWFWTFMVSTLADIYIVVQLVRLRRKV